MTRIVIDDQMSEFDVESGKRLGDFVDTVSSQLPPDRVIKEILLDGRYLPKSLRNQTLHSVLGEIKELQIRTADREVWAARGLEHATYAIERLQRSLLKAAELCFDRDSKAATRFLGQCLEGLEQFLENILVTRGVRGWNFDAIHADGIPLSQVERHFTKSLESLGKAHMTESFDTAADIIEYELIPSLSSWSNGLQQLRRSALSNT